MAVKPTYEDLEKKVQELETAVFHFKRAEEKLRKSEERYRTILGGIEDGYYEVDLAGNLAFFNNAVCELLGYSREDLMGMNNRQYTDEESSKKLYKAFNQVFRTGKPTKEFNWEVTRKDGTKRFLEVSVSLMKDTGGNPIGFRGIARDLTDHKQAEKELRESEERFRHLVEDAPFGLSLMHPNRKFEFFNQQFSSILGYSLEDLPDKDTWFVKAYPDEKYRDQVINAWKADLGKDVKAGEIKPREFRVRCKNGQDKMIHFRAVSLRDGRQVLTYEDITERKRAEEEREKLQAQLNQAQKMESVGRLAGGVAHDFNNMLQAIMGHTELALSQVEPGQPLIADLQEIRKAAERSGDLVRQLLAFARKQTISPKLLDLNDTVEGMLKMLRRLIGEDIDLAWLPGHGLWSVKVDPGQIDQILANLAVNARDAIDGVGKLTIETGNASLDEDYCREHAGFIPGNYVYLAVGDNGVGMDKDVLEHLFEPFFTTKEVGKGTGLGLATVYGIVKQNNGFINVYSEPGHGTVVKIYLPPCATKAEQVQKDVSLEPAPRGQETILLVEDEPTILNMTRTMLQRQGYTVLPAKTPGEAMRLAKERADDIHLLMTDVVMPEMNGRDLAMNLMGLRPDLKCLFTSGYTADVIAHHGVLADGVHFLQKPFTMKDLSFKVRDALEGR